MVGLPLQVHDNRLRGATLKRRNAADSTVLSTTILASALIVIVGAAYVAANNAINYQVESAEFDQAQNVLLSFAKVVKNVMLTPHSSGYVRSSFWKTIPQFEKASQNLTLTISDSGNNQTYNIGQNIIKIKGGYTIGVLTPRNLLGTDSLNFTDPSGSLARVRVFQSDGAWVSLDYSRVRCVYIGSSDYYNSTIDGYESLNVFEITLVNLTFGTFEPESQVLIIAENLGMNAEPESPIKVSNNTIIQVRLSSGEQSPPIDLADLISIQGGNPGKPILINLIIVDIECSMLKGV